MRTADNKSFWQRFARIYGPVMERSSAGLYAEICARIRPNLSRDMSVLELACGTGQLSHPLSGSVGLWEATDFSGNMIAEAKKKPHSVRLHFSIQDATALPYAPGSFDAVVISNALHIMPDPEKALDEIHRVLKPDGLLFAPTFVHGKGAGFRLRARLMALAGFHVYSKWNDHTYQAFVSDHGFCVVKAEHLGKSLAPLCYLEAHRIAGAQAGCEGSET